MKSPTEGISFGSSLIVPSVQELAKEHITKIPPRYVHMDQDPPAIPARGDASLPSVPVIDFKRLLLIDNPVDSELARLHLACKDWGFFQVINHGISASFLDDLRKKIVDFFKLPLEEKKKLWQLPDVPEGFGQSFVYSEEQKLDWSDMFYINTLPRNLRRNQLIEKLPKKVRETLDTYCAEVEKLAMTILSNMAKCLKMDEEIKELFTDGLQAIRMNYYPPCPEPNVAIGFTPHSDADAITILFQLNQTDGLEIRKDGKWLLVQPLPNAFVVNIGDMMEIMSNGVYRSIEHRATVNPKNERLSIAAFHCSNLCSELGPAKSILDPKNPAAFRRVPVEKYLKDLFAWKLNGKSYLDFMRIDVREANN